MSEGSNRGPKTGGELDLDLDELFEPVALQPSPEITEPTEGSDGGLEASSAVTDLTASDVFGALREENEGDRDPGAVLEDETPQDLIEHAECERDREDSLIADEAGLESVLLTDGDEDSGFEWIRAGGAITQSVGSDGSATGADDRLDGASRRNTAEAGQRDVEAAISEVVESEPAPADGSAEDPVGETTAEENHSETAVPERTASRTAVEDETEATVEVDDETAVEADDETAVEADNETAVEADDETAVEDRAKNAGRSATEPTQRSASPGAASGTSVEDGPVELPGDGPGHEAGVRRDISLADGTPDVSVAGAVNWNDVAAANATESAGISGYLQTLLDR